MTGTGAVLAGPRKGWSGVAAYSDVVPGDVISAVEALGLEILRVDDSGEIHTRCPAHLEILGRPDRHPSFSVNSDTGLFGCWSCGFKGRFADLVAFVLKIDRGDAVTWIRGRGTIQRVERLLAKKPVPVDTTQVVNEASLALMTAPPRWALRKRRLTAQACEKYGVLWEPRGELWITPVRTQGGRLLGWQEKNERYFRNHPPGLKKAQHLFGYHILPPRAERIILVESPLDAVVLESAGISGGVASYGASVSDAQMTLIIERTRHLVLALDNDGPGRSSRDKIIARWTGRGLAISTVDYTRIGWHGDPEGLDPGKLPRRPLRRLIDSAVPATIAAIALRS